MTDPWDVLRRLYASEINAGMHSDWDGGITVWIGGPHGVNPILSEATFGPDEFHRIAEWMDFEARRLFPDSDYARSSQ